MTNEEAIRELQWMRDNGYDAVDSIIGTDRCKEAFDMAIEALEKQIPRKPISFGHRHCPTCNAWLDYDELWVGRCFECAQAIDWSEEDD